MSNQNRKTLWNRLCELHLTGRALALAVAILAVWLLVLPLAFAASGVPGVLASLLAVTVCLVGGEAGLLIASLPGTLSAMTGGLVRMMLVLGIGLGLHFALPTLASAGFVFYLLAFYLIGLVPETILFLADASRSTEVRRAA